MPWAKLDDRFHDNRKIRRAWRSCPASVGLHVMAITYSAGQLLDGLIDRDFVDAQIPNRRARETAVASLVEAGLWLPADGGWQINDYLEFNPSRAAVEAKREKAAAAGRLGGQAKAATNGGEQSA